LRLVRFRVLLQRYIFSIDLWVKMDTELILTVVELSCYKIK
jgi:hypothetical protein